MIHENEKAFIIFTPLYHKTNNTKALTITSGTQLTYIDYT